MSFDKITFIYRDGRRCLSNALLQLHTRRSWDFLGLPLSHVKHKKRGNEIIGMMDSDDDHQHQTKLLTPNSHFQAQFFRVCYSQILKLRVNFQEFGQNQRVSATKDLALHQEIGKERAIPIKLSHATSEKQTLFPVWPSY